MFTSVLAFGNILPAPSAVISSACTEMALARLATFATRSRLCAKTFAATSAISFFAFDFGFGFGFSLGLSSATSDHYCSAMQMSTAHR